MRIIPVLDLKDGEVVRAEKGRRDRYRPIATRLCAGSDIVAGGLRGLYPFPTFYIADLDAIERGAPNHAALDRLKDLTPAPDLWLDAGFADAARLSAALADPMLRPVLGSESQRDDDLLRRFRGHPRLILSLDFFADGFRGPASILDEPDLWPDSVIVMTLAKVGSAAGPDFARLRDTIARAGGAGNAKAGSAGAGGAGAGSVKAGAQAGRRSVVAAGGVRNEADLRALADIGVTAALVATSLHDGTLTPAQLASLGA